MTQYCIKCGTELEPEWKMCVKCGQPTSSKEVVVQYSPQPQFVQNPSIIQTAPPSPYFAKNPYTQLNTVKIFIIIQFLFGLGLVGVIFLSDILYVDFLGVQVIIMSVGTFTWIVLIALGNIVLSIIVMILFLNSVKLLPKS